MDHSQRGYKGGKARAASMTPEQRTEVARAAANKRWSNRTGTATKEGHAEWTQGSSMVEKLIINVELSSGRFSTRVEVPTDVPEEAITDVVKAWLVTLGPGIRAARESKLRESNFKGKRELALEAAAQAFVAKVDRGEAKSTQSYEAFKTALRWGSKEGE